MSTRFKPAAAGIVGTALLACTTLSSLADDFLTHAASSYREKDFGAAYSSAGKSSDVNLRTFVRGMSALRLEKYEEAATLLAEVEQKVPTIGDYAALYQAEALLKLRRYPAALAKAAALPATYPASRTIRRAERLFADIQYEAGDYKGALKSYQSFVERYPSGSDSIEAAFSAARCREEVADTAGALLAYRSLWINNPASPSALKAQERIAQLERAGFKAPPSQPEELLKRASTLFTHNDFSASLKTLEAINTSALPPALTSRIDLRAGMAQFRLKQFKSAEKLFTKATASPLPAIRSEARFWLAKSLDRQDLKERAVALHMELAVEGKKQDFADDALIEAGQIRRGLGQYADAARLFEQAAKLSTDPKIVSKALWECGWSRYLGNDHAAASEAFKALLGDESLREKALYWLGRSQEKAGDQAASSQFRTLLAEYPSGFYATWYREEKGLKDTREPFGNHNALAELPLPPGFDKVRLLASVGLYDDAKGEMTALRKKIGEKRGQFPSLTRAYLEIQDYNSAIALFMQNRPIPWDRANLPLWVAGYPRAFADLVSPNAAANGLSEALVYALIRAESGFSPTIKSPVGAIGLMQMMPATAKQTAKEKGTFNPQRLTIPEYNVRLGTRHLHDLMKEHSGDIIFMAAAYNAGSAALERWKKNFKQLRKDEFIESIPYQETRDYVKKVYASAATYRQLYGVK